MTGNRSFADIQYNHADFLQQFHESEIITEYLVTGAWVWLSMSMAPLVDPEEATLVL